MMSMVVGVIGGGVAVKIGRMHCLHVYVPACVGKAGEVGVADYWVWGGLAVELIENLSY